MAKNKWWIWGIYLFGGLRQGNDRICIKAKSNRSPGMMYCDSYSISCAPTNIYVLKLFDNFRQDNLCKSISNHINFSSSHLDSKLLSDHNYQIALLDLLDGVMLFRRKWNTASMIFIKLIFWSVLVYPWLHLH